MKQRVIFIPGNVPSSKNLYKIVTTGSFPKLVPGKLVRNYIKNTESLWQAYRQPFLDLVEKLDRPYRVGIHFIRNSKHKYDWVNPVQMIQDLMVKYEWVEDDSINFMYPFPAKYHGEYSTYNKLRPGVRISVYPNVKKELHLTNEI